MEKKIKTGAVSLLFLHRNEEHVFQNFLL